MGTLKAVVSKFKRVIREQLTQGADPRSLALGCAMAYAIGTFPFIGLSTTMCLILGYLFKVNQPVMQIVNYAVYPLQILLIPVFLRIGEHLTGATPVAIRPSKLIELLTSNWRLFFERYGIADLHAILAWAILSPIVGFIVFQLTKRVFERMTASWGR